MSLCRIGMCRSEALLLLKEYIYGQRSADARRSSETLKTKRRKIFKTPS